MENAVECGFELIPPPEGNRRPLSQSLWRVTVLARMVDYKDYKTQFFRETEYYIIAANAVEVVAKTFRYVPEDHGFKGFVIGAEILKVEWVSPVTDVKE